MYHPVFFSKLEDMALISTDKNLCLHGAYILIGIEKKTEAQRGLMDTCPQKQTEAGLEPTVI